MSTFMKLDMDKYDLTETILYDTDIIKSCYAGLLESSGSDNNVFYTTAQKYTTSLVSEFLEQIHKALLNLYKAVVKFFHGFCTTDYKTAIKYKEKVIERIHALDSPIIYETYSYPKLYEFPKTIKKSASETERILRELIDIMTGSKTLVQHNMKSFIDKKIIEFGKEVLDRNVDPVILAASVERISYQALRGNKITTQLDKRNIEKFYDDLEFTIKHKNDVESIKTEVEGYYQNIKRQMTTLFNLVPVVDDLNPNFGKINVSDVRDITFFDLQRNRLLNAYLIIYRTAFEVKLNVINDKIRIHRNVLSEIFKRTSMFTNLLNGNEIHKMNSEITKKI